MLGFTRLLAALASGDWERSCNAAPAPMLDPRAIAAAIRRTVLRSGVELIVSPIGRSCAALKKDHGLHVRDGVLGAVHAHGDAVIDLVRGGEAVRRIVGRGLRAARGDVRGEGAGLGAP